MKVKLARIRKARISTICVNFTKKLYQNIKRWKLTMRAYRKVSISNSLRFYFKVKHLEVTRKSNQSLG